MHRNWMGFLAATLVLISALSAIADQVDIAPLAAALQAVGSDGQGHAQAMQAWKGLARADAKQLPDILDAMQQGNPLADNWFRALVATIADRAEIQGERLPAQQLLRFLDDRTNAPRARWLAYELLVRVDSENRLKLVENRLDDPCLPLRREAVTQAIAGAEQTPDPSQRVAAFQKILQATRDVDQIEDLAKKIGELGQTVDLPRVFGFVLNWRLIGPFNNKADAGFEVAYPPELTIDLNAVYEGAEGQVGWKEYTSDDAHGEIDLNEAVGKFKGAICYAYTEFVADEPGDVELRLACTNGNKIWLNGELLSSNHVYHSGMFIDQYVGRGRLHAGKNTILLKVAQNEQTESWAQDWKFQLRVCDPLGAALHTSALPANK